MKKNILKFISYDGGYPNLCSGTLVLELNNKEIIFPDYCLRSGGCVCFDDGGDECVEEGEWTIESFPDDFPEELKQEAEDLVNQNVSYGCCGGCI